MPPINPPVRRARDRDGSPIQPMSLGNMRELGVRCLDVECLDCGHSVAVNVDPLPDVADRFLCSACGGRHIMTRPNWREYNMTGMVRQQRAEAHREVERTPNDLLRWGVYLVRKKGERIGTVKAKNQAETMAKA